ncbi:C39 family peptidase [Sulfobacillus thermosulfidooxidans]|uniref:C39 family peptidase n=1 Tax=Sulfobacillus thermosulfidooxidans TaxID=28034 RepID=UPI00031787CE|nr:C39 family peptidase [Sulfobacillus thermosulfidooxidans]
MSRKGGITKRRVSWPRLILIVGVAGGLTGAAIVHRGSIADYVGGQLGLNALGRTNTPSAPKSSKQRVEKSTGAKASPTKHSTDPKSIPASYLMHVPAQSQFPQLANGCEVTSLSMLLTAVGHPVSKMTLAKEMPKAQAPLKLAQTTNAQGKKVNKVVSWGNPNVGFVGSVYKAGYGYGIYNGPMTKLLNKVWPGRAVNLTRQPFSAILAHVAKGVPVEVWTTLTFKPTSNWVTWNSPQGPVHATPLEHAVIIVGYSPHYLYINNPWTGQAGQKVAKAPFIAAWNQLGDQAITVKASSKTS